MAVELVVVVKPAENHTVIPKLIPEVLKISLAILNPAICLQSAIYNLHSAFCNLQSATCNLPPVNSISTAPPVRYPIYILRDGRQKVRLRRLSIPQAFCLSCTRLLFRGSLKDCS